MADGQKTEQPSQKRLNEAKKQGRFPVSRDLVAAAQFCLFIWLATRSAPAWLEALRRMMRALLAAAFDTRFTPQTLLGLASSLSEPILWPALKLGAMLVAATLTVQLASTQLGIAPGRLSPDFTRLNSFPRIAQLPRHNAMEALYAIMTLPIFVYLIMHVFEQHGAAFQRLSAAGIEAAIERVGIAMGDVLWQGSLLLLTWGLIDYARQRSKWSGELKMSRQELQDENKEAEGNTQMKARIRRLMRERSRRRMMKDVETATAVVVNPTHYAVAIKYDAGEMPAPKVVAKGKNYLAARIRERAIKHQVPIVENPPLARALYKNAAIGQEIPADLFRAVAEVLAYIYRVMNQVPGRRRPSRP